MALVNKKLYFVKMSLTILSKTSCHRYSYLLCLKKTSLDFKSRLVESFNQTLVIFNRRMIHQTINMNTKVNQFIFRYLCMVALIDIIFNFCCNFHCTWI